MRDFVVVFLCCVSFLGLLVWLAYPVVKEFGWRGLLVKAALIIIGFFLVFPIALHSTPWNAIRYHPTFVGNPTCCFLCALLWDYLLVGDRPMRWLLKPAVECFLYSAAALVIAGTYAGAKGWI